MRSLRDLFRARREYALYLAQNTPLTVREAKAVLKKIAWKPGKALEVVEGKVCPWEPRATFFTRVMDAIRG